MRPDRWSRHLLLVSLLPVVMATAAYAQSGVKVTVSDVTDDRMSSDMLSGSLQVQLNLEGSGMDKVVAARAIVKEARDDRGTNLAKDKKVPDFRDRNVNGGVLEVSLDSPPRAASSISMKGTVELFMPSKDPAAVITIPKAFAKMDKPLASDALASAGIKLTPLSPERYAEEKKKQKITDKDIEEIRAQGKAHGASEKEIEFAIGMAKAMEEMGGQAPPEGSVILSGSSKDFDKIHAVDIIGPDKKQIDVNARESSTRGDSTIMILHPSSLPAGSALRLTLLTAKSRVSVPFELKKVELP